MGDGRAWAAEPSPRRAAAAERLGADCAQAPSSSGHGLERRSESPPTGVASASAEQTHDKQKDRRAEEGHDHLADDRVTRDPHVEVQQSGEHDASDEGSDDADDDVPEQAEPMTQRDVTGQESRDQTDQGPDQDRVQVQRDRLTADRDDHLGLIPPTNMEVGTQKTRESLTPPSY